MDIVNFMILKHISDVNKDKLNSVDATIENWFISLTMFAGQFLKKYKYVINLIIIILIYT